MFQVLSLALLLLLDHPSQVPAEKYFSSHGVKIRYVESGQGVPVVLLHGFGASAEMWTKSPFGDVKVMSDLARSYRVIALDFRGHGKSDKPHDTSQYGLEMVRDVMRLLDHLQIKKAHLVGYSMGASMAGHLLAAHPERWLSVTLGGGAPPFAPSQAFISTISATADALEQGKGIGPLVAALTPAGQPKPAPEQATAMGQLYMLGQDQKALAAVLRGWRSIEISPQQLKAVKAPTLLIHGSREAELLLENIEKAKKALPRVKVTVVDGGDHMSTLLRPEFSQAILQFLNEQGR